LPFAPIRMGLCPEVETIPCSQLKVSGRFRGRREWGDSLVMALKCPLLRDSKKPEVGSEADLRGHREVTRLTPTGPQTC
jgi:hypothetical protein